MTERDIKLDETFKHKLSEKIVYVHSRVVLDTKAMVLYKYQGQSQLEVMEMPEFFSKFTKING